MFVYNVVTHRTTRTNGMENGMRERKKMKFQKIVEIAEFDCFVAMRFGAARTTEHCNKFVCPTEEGSSSNMHRAQCTDTHSHTRGTKLICNSIGFGCTVSLSHSQ